LGVSEFSGANDPGQKKKQGHRTLTKAKGRVPSEERNFPRGYPGIVSSATGDKREKKDEKVQVDRLRIPMGSAVKS